MQTQEFFLSPALRIRCRISRQHVSRLTEFAAISILLLMKCISVKCVVAILAMVVTFSGSGVTVHRSFRGGYPESAQRAGAKVRTEARAKAPSLQGAADFSCFRDKTWVTGSGKVTRVLDDDVDPPCHQRFMLSDDKGHSILIAHNIDEYERVADLAVGDIIAFKGEFLHTSRGDLVHWTHPGNSAYKPGGWIKKLQAAEPRIVTEVVQDESNRREYFAGSGPMSERIAAPETDEWPETGYWLSTNSGARHNKGCENYRKTRGYPCKKSDGRPCGKCGG